jgi:molybdopterin-containing oxidoreductase family molybdopterin binding subunit
MSKVETEIKGKPKTTELTRRGFVAAFAAAAGSAALAGSFTGCSPKAAEDAGAPISQAPPEEIYQGVCRGNCGGGCRMNVHVRDGKLVKTSVIIADDPLDSKICARGLTHAQRINAPERLQYPMRRKEGTARGAGEWERISWDEAVEEITTKWKSYIEEFGGSSIGYVAGTGTKGFNYQVYARLWNMMGATKFEPQYDAASLQMTSESMGWGAFLAGNDYHDSMLSKCVFIWGANATSSLIARWRFIKQARVVNGAKIVVIDPHFTDAAAKADIWVPIRPATDGALALAMINIIIQENLHDVEYLLKNTVAPFLVKADTGKFLRKSDLGVEPTEGPPDAYGRPTVVDPIVVMGEDGIVDTPDVVSSPSLSGSYLVEGHQVVTAFDKLVERAAEWTPERTSEYCDIPTDTISELVHLYAEGPSTLLLGYGNDHWGNGASITHCQVALALVAGQCGKPGAGINGHAGASATGMYVNYAKVMFPEGAVGGLSSALQYLPSIIETGKFGDKDLPIKSLFCYAGNPLTCHTERGGLIEAFDKIDLIVVADTVMNDTARYADYLLPVPHWFEYETFIASTNPWCILSEKAMEPQFESKDDIEIVRMLGLAMGYAEQFENLSPETVYTDFLDNDACKAFGLSWETLKQQKIILAAQIPYYYGNVDYNAPFLTPSGRAEFYLETPKPPINFGQQLDIEQIRLPFVEPAIEAWPTNPLIEQYPLTIISFRDRFKVHSSFALTPWLLEIQPEPTLSINPVDAEARGIVENDYVKVYNERGFVVLKAHLDPSFRPGTVKTEHTWLQEQYKEGHYAALTSNATRNYKPNCSFFDVLCQVEKV